MQCDPIGIIHSSFKDMRQVPRQSSLVPNMTAYIELTGPVRDALIGLEEYSHIWILGDFHQSLNKHPMVQPPRLNGGWKGVYATRAPNRGNAISLSVAEIDRIAYPRIYIKGVDLLDGTPVLDIKPYIPMYDAHPEAKVPDWIEGYKPLGPFTFKDAAIEKICTVRPEIIECIQTDLRSKKLRRTQRLSQEPLPMVFHTKDLEVDYTIDPDMSVTIDRIEKRSAKNES